MTTESNTPCRDLFDLVHGFAIASIQGELTDDEITDFEQLLRDNPEARRLYAMYLSDTVGLVAALSDFAPVTEVGERRKEAATAPHASAASAPASPLQPTAHSPQPTPTPVLGFLAGIVDYVSNSRTLLFWFVFGSLGIYFAGQLGALLLSRSRATDAELAGAGGRSHRESTSGVQRESGKSIGRLTNAIDCVWEGDESAGPSRPFDNITAVRPSAIRGEGELALDVGDEFHARQRLNLAAGLAELTFVSGAKVILHGPARFVATDPLGGNLQLGKLTAKVPHAAVGFTVVTPSSKVVDLGTEFGVNVADDRTTHVIVYVGEVEISSGSQGAGGENPTEGAAMRVKAGQAVSVSPDRTIKTIAAENERFIRDLAPLANKPEAEAAYVELVKKLKPVVWFRMEQSDGERALRDDAGGPEAKLFWDGPGNPFVKGLVGKSLWLRGPQLKDYALLADYPKSKNGRLSCSAWVYADSSPGWCLIAANWAGKLHGQFHFGLRRNAAMSNEDLRIEIADRAGESIELREGDAHPFPLNSWQHVAFTTDGSTLRLYRQGREVALRRHAGLAFPVDFRALTIGAKSSDIGKGAIFDSYWSGKLDEIAVFNDALTAENVQKLAAMHPH